jgi:hypothetical protein
MSAFGILRRGLASRARVSTGTLGQSRRHVLQVRMLQCWQEKDTKGVMTQEANPAAGL